MNSRSPFLVVIALTALFPLTALGQEKTDNQNQDLDRSAAAASSGAMRGVIAKSVDASLTRGGIDTLLQNLTRADRERIAKDKIPAADLNGLLEQFKNEWSLRYRQDFKLGATIKDVLNDSNVQIIEEAASGNSTAATETHVITDAEANAAVRAEAERRAGIGDSTGAHDRTGAASGIGDPTGSKSRSGAASGIGDITGSKSRTGAAAQPAPANIAAPVSATPPAEPKPRTATVIVLATDVLPDVTLKLVMEGQQQAAAWKIDVPDSLDAQHLHDNLVRHLQELHDGSPMWPADINMAYRLVTQHVLAALTESGGGGAKIIEVRHEEPPTTQP